MFQQQQEAVTPERMKKLETMFKDDFRLITQKYHSLVNALTKNRARLMEVSVSRGDERACSTGLEEANIIQESILDLGSKSQKVRSPSEQSQVPKSTKKRPSHLIFVTPNRSSHEDLSHKDSIVERWFDVYHDSQEVADGQDDSNAVNPNTLSILRGLGKARNNVVEATKKIEGCTDILDGDSEGSILKLSESELDTDPDSVEVTTEEVRKLILKNKEITKEASR